MNLFPYNSGHLLVCPYRHVSDYTELTNEERVELGDLTATAMRVSREVAGPHGFNLGMNQGEVAGAGIAAHLHQHVVPRWAGDANFLPIIARTKAVPSFLRMLAPPRRRLASGGLMLGNTVDPSRRQSLRRSRAFLPVSELPPTW